MENIRLKNDRRAGFNSGQIGAENPIALDNKYFNIQNGDLKMLDQLDNSATMMKGHLAAQGVIKLCPHSYKYDYGAIATPVLTRDDIEQAAADDEYKNEWDNIFVINQNPEDISRPDNKTNNFFANPELGYSQFYPQAV